MPHTELRDLIEKARLKGFRIHYYESNYQFQIQVFNREGTHQFSRIASSILTHDQIRKKNFTRDQTKSEVKILLAKLIAPTTKT